MNEQSKHDWRSTQLTEDYLEGVRGGIPLAETQIEIILRIVRSWVPDFKIFLDMGCGDGILGRQLLHQWPETHGIFMDFSQPMIDSAKEKCQPYADRSTILLQDYSLENWTGSLQKHAPLDVVISGYSIHHHDDDIKYRIYREVFGLLKPGGLFLNLEHVASPNPVIEKLFDETFIDGLYDYHVRSGGNSSKQEIAEKFYNREDKVLNKLTLVEKQNDWLREIGYQNVDCFFKLFELALFGGQKPV